MAALPVLLGFVPHESVVLLCLDHHGRLGLTLRLDLPPAAQEREVADELVARVRHSGSARVYVLVLSEQPGRPQQALVLRLRERLDVVDALLVRAGRWESWLCTDPRCCPPGGTPLLERSAQVDRVRAEGVLRGRAVLPSREALVASLARPGCSPERWEQAAADLRAERRRAGPTAVRARLRRVLAEAVATGSRGERTDLVEPALALDDVRLRDELLVRQSDDDAVLALLLAMARATPPPHDAPVCATLAWVAYGRGDGALASVALDRALATDPAHGLARLLRRALDAQVRPVDLREVLACTAVRLGRP